MTTAITLPAKSVLAAAIVAGDPRRLMPDPDDSATATDPLITLLPAHPGALLVATRESLCAYVEHIDAQIDTPMQFRVPPAGMTALHDCDEANGTLTLVAENGLDARAHLTIATGEHADRPVTVSTDIRRADLRQADRIFGLLACISAYRPSPAMQADPILLSPLIDAAIVARRDCAWRGIYRAGPYLVVQWRNVRAIGICVVIDEDEAGALDTPDWVHAVAPIE